MEVPPYCNLHDTALMHTIFMSKQPQSCNENPSAVGQTHDNFAFIEDENHFHTNPYSWPPQEVTLPLQNCSPL